MTENTDALAVLRQERANAYLHPVKRGKKKINNDDLSGLANTFSYGLITFIASLIVLLIISHYVTIPFGFDAFTVALYISFIVMGGYATLPIWEWLRFLVLHRRLPEKDALPHLLMFQKAFSLLLITFLLTYGFNHTYPWLKEEIISQSQTSTAVETKHHGKHHVAEVSEPSLPLNSIESFSGAWLGLSLFLWITITNLKSRQPNRPRHKPVKTKNFDTNPAENHPFHLWLGTSTGRLSDRNHLAGMADNHAVALTFEEACQNILILGAIGSGKTTRAMHPLLLQLLDQQAGGLIFDIKGDFHQAVNHFANRLSRTVTTIGVGFRPINLLAGLTPEMAASFLKSVFVLTGGHRGDSFWVDTATELCRNTLGLLMFIPEHYSLQGLYHYLFDAKKRIELDAAISVNSESLNEQQQRLLATYQRYHEHIFDPFDEKVKASVMATVAQVLAPFDHPDLVDAFCSASSDAAPVEAVLDGQIYLVELPLARWGLGGKVVYTLLKLRFFNVMQQRTLHSAWNQERPVFFMCDEYQEIVSANKDGLSDLNFWDKSRSSKTIGIISAQAISSFYAAIGDRDVADALLQNFRQKICFRTEDNNTLQYFDRLVDKVEVKKVSYSDTSGTTSKGFLGHDTSKNSSSTTNISFHDKSVLDAQVFRNMEGHHAVALLSKDGRSLDDIISMLAVYLNK